MSRLTDQTGLLKKLSEKNLCVSCLHSLNNGDGGNRHNCRDSFKVKDKKTGEEVVKSALCPKFCRAPSGNKRLHNRICSCAANEYTNKLRTLQSKMIELRPISRRSVTTAVIPGPSVVEEVGHVVITSDHSMVPEGEVDVQHNGTTALEIANQSQVNIGCGRVILANTTLTERSLEPSNANGDDGEPGFTINGCHIGQCVRLSEQVHLQNDLRSRHEGLLWDSGATNTISSPEVADLTTNSWVLPESFDLITQQAVEEIELVRDQFKTSNNLQFQAIRLKKSPEDMSFVLMDVPEEYQRRFGMNAQYSVQVAGHSIIAGADMTQNFPEILAIDQQTGFGVFRSRITGECLPFSTGVVDQYCDAESQGSQPSATPAR